MQISFEGRRHYFTNKNIPVLENKKKKNVRFVLLMNYYRYNVKNSRVFSVGDPTLPVEKSIHVRLLLVKVNYFLEFFLRQRW